MVSSDSNSISGILDVHSKGFGFVRQKSHLYSESDNDPYVPPEMIRRIRLKSGCLIEGEQGVGREGKPVLSFISTVNGLSPDAFSRLPAFSSLTTISPDEKIHLETKGGPLSMRIMDLLVPLGKGSRSLIVSPPKAGKTTILKELAHAVAVNHPEIQIYALLIDERPEEVTDIRRSIKGEVLASSMDQSIGNHVRLARLASEMVKRKVEAGENVFLLIDSITRVSRAFNNMEGNSGRTLSGGLDSRAMEFPRSFFGSARKIEHKGSLTIIGTTLVETGSRMDELIFQEFQGTGNQEVILSRKLADKRIFPAIDIIRSRTRREELILSPDDLEAATRIRKGLSGLNPDVAMERLIETIQKYETNADFVRMLLNAKVSKSTPIRED
ncbi:MAG: transcription termination factor Rho [Candidatus Aureabacteria bacterium]|nr:transcription termination factor Rho [Candidatus Auribacterota bacterium]